MTSTTESELTGPLDFQELMETLDLSVVALGPEWEIKYYNKKGKEFLRDSAKIGDSFWEALNSDFLTCFQRAYKKALLGKSNQLDLPGSESPKSDPNIRIYEDMPLDMLEQKATQFEFRCERTGFSYAAAFNLHRGNFLFRVHDITDRVNALLKAERNRQELKQALEDMREARNANPLTGLPGNIRIEEQIQSYLDEGRVFALVYADLDHFKPFNDRYGFDRGDKVLLKFRDILREALDEHPAPVNFLGHVGGDDFVAMVAVDQCESFCEYVIEEFDREIPEMYDESDRELGGIATRNREGEKEIFPIMTLSMAVVTNDERTFEKYLRMTETAAEVKKYVKENRTESNYQVDRRTDL